MGLTRRLVRHATPRSVRRAMHPVRTARIAVTPRAIRRASYVAYTVTNPLGAAENRLISAAFHNPSNSRSAKSGTTFSPTDQFIYGSGVRAEEGANSADYMEHLMSVAHQKFYPIEPIKVEEAQRQDPKNWFNPEWRRRRTEFHFWQRTQLRELRLAVSNYANECANRDLAEETARRKAHQAEIDEWWKRLTAGDVKVVEKSLIHAFSDNVAKVRVLRVYADSAVLVIALPGFSVLPEKRVNVTPTGKLSAKKWSKTEEQQAYAELVGAHLIATVREGFAVAPSLTQLRVVGVLSGMDTKDGFMFDVDVSRNSKALQHDTFGYYLLENSPLGLKRKGKTREVFCRPAGELRPILNN